MAFLITVLILMLRLVLVTPSSFQISSRIDYASLRGGICLQSLLLTPALLLNEMRGLSSNSSVSKDDRERPPLKFET